MSARLGLLLVLALGEATVGLAGAPRAISCCPIGSFVVLDGLELACRDFVRPNDTSAETGVSSQELFPGFPGFPDCGDSSYWLQQFWEDVVEVSSNSCFGPFLDVTTGLVFPVLVRCRAHAIQMRSPSLRALEFRKCCPADQAYDADGRHCAPAPADFGFLFKLAPGLDLLRFHAGPPGCEHAIVDYKIDRSDVYALGDNVMLTVEDKDGKKNVSLTIDNGCLDAEAGSDSVAVRLCTGEDYCLHNACIRKCCKENEVNSKCVDQSIFNFEALRNFRTEVAASLANDSNSPPLDLKSYGLLTGYTCAQKYMNDPEEHWAIGTNGEILTPPYDDYNHANSCLELIFDSNGDYELAVQYCFDDDRESYWQPPITFKIVGALALVSCCFLAITLIVYICLPSLQNLHGKTLMCHTASLFLAYACLAAIRPISSKADASEGDGLFDYFCQYLGYGMLFSFLATFFWLNVMCFDIWWTFGGLGGTATGDAARKRRRERRRFWMYCGYAWGLALLLTGLAVGVGNSGLLGNNWFGQERCWFEYKPIAEYVFFLGPISVTLLVNLVFFAMTAHRCSKVKAEIKRVMASGVKDKKTKRFLSDKTRLIMNLKLFVVMGIPWVMENATAYLNYLPYYTWTRELFYVTDIINALQGLWIFLLFVMKPKVYQALRKRFRPASSTSKGSNNALTTVHLHRMGKSASSATISSNVVNSTSAIPA